MISYNAATFAFSQAKGGRVLVLSFFFPEGEGGQAAGYVYA